LSSRRAEGDAGTGGVRLLIVGPPGAGKGTQSARISEAFGVPTISTGDIFRANIAKGTPLGKQVKAIVDAGDYVPDELTNALVTDRLKEADAHGGFLLDGYPRTPDQVIYLDNLLAGHGHSLDAVVQLVADQEEIIRRLRQRAEQEGRADDSEESMRHRQEVYLRETAPLLSMFRDRGLLIEVDGLGPVDEVSERVANALAERGIVPSDEPAPAS
jgi:adenylate kinase